MKTRTPYRSRPFFALLSILWLCLPMATASADTARSDPGITVTPVEPTPDLDIREARIVYLEGLDLLVFELDVAGTAGATAPRARGQLDGAPVLGYVFPTTLAARDVGFGDVDGTVALAVTSHPDFDDTPLWDENGNRDYGDDGVVFHTHWVVLVEDERVAGGLAVRQFAEGSAAVLPPTNPGMPMYMDSPGFSVLLQGKTLKALVPAQRVSGRTDFRADAVTAYMQVATTGNRPLLGVYRVYEVHSGELDLSIEIERR
ncbi:MAG: hypothetical protein MI919_30595 [Holophagales bacterium]|nr:hypothetical protein [Holophagales bacterium]